MSAVEEMSDIVEEEAIWTSAESAKQIQRLGQVEQVRLWTIGVHYSGHK